MTLNIRQSFDFEFGMVGVACTNHQILAWLAADLGYPMEIEPQYDTIFCTLPEQHGFRIYVWWVADSQRFVLSAQTDTLRQPHFHGWMLMFAQDVFCSLERYGLRVEYLDGNIEWVE